VQGAVLVLADSRTLKDKTRSILSLPEKYEVASYFFVPYAYAILVEIISPLLRLFANERSGRDSRGRRTQVVVFCILLYDVDKNATDTSFQKIRSGRRRRCNVEGN
jgi:hypothetical protein